MTALLKVFIDPSGEAFRADCGTEMARILRKLADQLQNDEFNNDTKLLDVNGNACGRAYVG